MAASLRSSERFFLRKCGRRRCAETIAHTVFFFILPRVSVGLERAAGDGFFGLIGFRCESPCSVRAHARRTQAGTHTLKLGCVRGVGQATLQPLARVGSQRACVWVGAWCVGSRAACVGGGGMCRQPTGESRLEDGVLISAPHLTCPTGQRSW